MVGDHTERSRTAQGTAVIGEHWTLTKAFTFEASHQLPRHDGKCARLHGHSWVGEIEVAGPRLIKHGPKSGMLTDYQTMKDAIEPLVRDYLDHYHLNESLKLENPTSEEIARWIFLHLYFMLPGLVAVTIRETCTSSCRYTAVHQTTELDEERTP